MRDAESLLDQLASYDQGHITADQVRAALGIGASETVMMLVDSLLAGDVSAGLSVINDSVDEGVDPRRFATQVVEHLRALLLLRLDSEVVSGYVTEDARPRLEEQAEGFSPAGLAQTLRLFNRAATEPASGWQPQLLLEMAMVETVLPGSSQASVPATPFAREVGQLAAPPSSRAAVQDGARGGRDREEKPAQREHASSVSAVAETGPAFGAMRPIDGPLTPDVLRSRWPDLLGALRQRNLPLEALMRSSTAVAVEGDVVVLGFEYDLHRGRVDEDSNKRDVQEVLSDLAGRPVQVRCVLARERSDGAAKMGQSAPATPPEAPVDDDPVVKAALDLGAQVVARSD
jgi:DNA polymerase-3 subunit gamma/tau